MSSGFNQMLDASIRYLEELKKEGRGFVTVAPESVKLLKSLSPSRAAEGASERARLPAPPPSRASSMKGDLLRDRPPAPGPRLDPAGNDTARATLAEGAGPAGAAKALAIADLRERALACMKCPHLARSRRNVVFGVGNLDADLMFVGEAPGMDEDEAGEPFVGRAGQLLTRIIETTGLKRSEVYIANIVKCRPDTPGRSSGNRKPTLEEMQTCVPYLHAQIDLIGPKVLVALGATAMEGLLGKTAGITRLRGTWHEYRNIPLMPTYHPAYLLRNQSLQEKRRVWEDMLAVMEKLGMPISERHRGFFLAGR